MIYHSALPINTGADFILPRSCSAVFAGSSGTLTFDSGEIKSAEAIITTVNPSTGAITGVQLLNGGFGYESAPTVNVTPTLGSGAIITATITNGVVTSLHISSGGTGYSILRPAQIYFTGGRSPVTMTLLAGITPISVSKVYKASDAIAATLSHGTLNQEITFTANSAGASGNSIAIQLIVPGPSTALSVSSTGNTILVTLQTDGGGLVLTTITQLIAAIVANGNANSLVTASTTGNGTGLATVMALTALSGGINSSTQATGLTALYI